MDKALLAVGQGISNLGQPDPRLLASGRQHPLLAAFLKALRDEDAPASRAYPANITVIRGLLDALDLADPVWGSLNSHVVDLIIVAFFWLLRPAEYLESAEPEARTQAFQLSHVSITIGGTV